MENQKNLITERDWNCLIILDACRYDYFEKNYSEFLSGKLRKVLSSGPTTDIWLKKTFGSEKFDDTVYVSGNPYINSHGAEVVKGFNANEHFHEIIDVWESGWDDKLKTVKAKTLGKATRMARGKYPDKRIIAHFTQPHQPYLSLGPIGKGFSHGVESAHKKGEALTRRLRHVVGRLLPKIIGWKRTYRLRQILNLTKVSEIEAVAKEHGRDGLEKAYTKNLISALEEVVKLVDRLPDKSIVITADHGEFLGEENIYGHHPLSDHKILREVPWLECEG